MPFIFKKVNQINDFLRRQFAHQKQINVNAYVKKTQHLDLKLDFLSSFPVQFSSVTQSCPTLCNPMNHSTPGFPVHHWLLESSQTHVHWVGDAIQSSHPRHPLLLLPSIFLKIVKWVSSSHQVAKVLEFQLQHQSFQWTPRTDLP